MRTDRLTTFILTVIALELFWIGLNSVPAVSAQDAATPVVITGIAIPADGDAAPVRLLPVRVNGTVDIRATTPLAIEAREPLKVEADDPLPVQSVPFTPGVRPGD